MIVRAKHDPFFQMIDNGDGSIYPVNEARLIVHLAEWQDLKARIDQFYSACNDQEIESFNQDADGHKAQPVRQKTPGHVYLIHGVDTPWYKIGLSVDAKIRLKQLGTQGPFKLSLVHVLAVADMCGVETYFHQLFHHKRTHGEWFKLSQDDVQTFIEWQSEQ